MGLNPTEILLLAQVMEYHRTTGDFFESDQALATDFGVSDKTISRAVTSLTEKGLITKETKNIKGGKIRHIFLGPNLESATTDKKSVVNKNSKVNNGQNVCCAKDNLSVVNGQNDLIKDNIKDNKKDNKENFSPVEAEEAGTANNPIVVEKKWLVERMNELVSCANGLFKYGNKFYKIGEKEK